MADAVAKTLLQQNLKAFDVVSAANLVLQAVQKLRPPYKSYGRGLNSISEGNEPNDDPFENWSEGDRDAQPELPFAGTPGLTDGLGEGQIPLHYFQTLLPGETVDTMVEETNRYGNQQLDLRQGQLGTFSRFRKWHPTNRGEMLKFLAIVIAMGLVRQSNVTDYWSTRPVTATPFFSSTMSRDRFLLLMSFFHLNNNARYIARESPGHDPLFKLGTVYSSILYKFATTYKPHQFISVDEGMVPWRGNLAFSVYSPNKPIKYGLKAYMLCDSVSGYCLRFNLYTGRRVSLPSEHGTIYDLVMDLLRGRFGQGHVLFCDNYYSSPRLFMDLWELGVTAVGTCRKNRKGLPQQLKLKQLANKGDTYIMSTGPLSGMKYNDSNIVYILTTSYTCENVTHKQKIRPKCVVMYDKFMGGVDRSDQMVANFRLDLKVLKWWKKVFFHILGLTVLNSYIKYKGNVRNPMTHKQFRERLVEELVELGNICNTIPAPLPGRPKSQPLDRLTARNHFPRKLAGINPSARRCIVCNPAVREILASRGEKRKRPSHETFGMAKDTNM
ncbi:PGBD4-like protein [Mya arenaria]|uniref:PGBD4-like protein n=1 Tax=Mya arenaria TaxID=6604 RepID=A0ABY7F8R5_MYAAR|nr:PGBD4-like protein [Mya arenaria]